MTVDVVTDAPSDRLALHHALPPPPGRWSLSAACAAPGLDPAVRDTFTADTPTAAETAALAVCAGCPVAAACCGWATTVRTRTGVWGGRRFGPAPAAPRGPRARR